VGKSQLDLNGVRSPAGSEMTADGNLWPSRFVREPLLGQLEFGKPPRAVLRIAVNEVYFHCGKAAMRTGLWSNDARIDRSSFPSIGEINHAQTSLGVPESQATIEAIYKEQLSVPVSSRIRSASYGRSDVCADLQN